MKTTYIAKPALIIRNQRGCLLPFGQTGCHSVAPLQISPNIRGQNRRVMANSSEYPWFLIGKMRTPLMVSHAKIKNESYGQHPVPPGSIARRLTDENRIYHKNRADYQINAVYFFHICKARRRAAYSAYLMPNRKPLPTHLLRLGNPLYFIVSQQIVIRKIIWMCCISTVYNIKQIKFRSI